VKEKIFWVCMITKQGLGFAVCAEMDGRDDRGLVPVP
jgi:hypothetical protein